MAKKEITKKDAMALLELMAKTEPSTKKKNSAPSVQIKDELVPIMKKMVEAKRAKKSQEAIQKQQEEILRPEAMKLRNELCKSRAECLSCIELTAPDCEPVSFVVQNKYSDIPLENKAALVELFGDEMDKVFLKQTEISIKPEAMAKIDEILPKLFEALGGAAKFKEVFSVKQCFTVTNYGHESIACNDKVAALMSAAVEKDLIKPASPSFR